MFLPTKRSLPVMALLAGLVAGRRAEPGGVRLGGARSVHPGALARLDRGAAGERGVLLRRLAGEQRQTGAEFADGRCSNRQSQPGEDAKLAPEDDDMAEAQNTYFS